MPIVLALIALFSLMGSPQAQTPAGLGQMVSPETWDETVKSFKGRPTLVTFWEVACEPCLEEMPGLIEVSRELAPKGLQVCEVNTDPQARFEAAVRLLDKLQVPFQRY
jgi:thiol-disulfide isomerase/thioredoxin